MHKRKVNVAKKKEHSQAMVVGSIQHMLDEIRAAMARCTVPEKECYEALVTEAAGWEERLRELEEDDGD
jgi:hypothetical protein